MDRITKKLLQDFLEAQEMESSDEPSDFELFCNYSVLANEYNKTFDVKNITVGAGADTGIDGIAIIVNGHLVEDTDEIDILLEANGYLEVTYIFVQAKTSSNFELPKFWERTFNQLLTCLGFLDKQPTCAVITPPGFKILFKPFIFFAARSIQY